MAVRIQIRRDIASNWANVNPLLMEGELGIETDTKRVKIGNGVNNWAALEYSLTDVFEYNAVGSFPVTGITGKLYIDTTAGKVYRWTGSAYAELSVAPVQSVAGRTGAVVLTKSDVNLANVDNTSDISKPVSTAQATAIEVARANAIQRSNHTGSQAIATITGLQTALDGKEALGVANAVLSLHTANADPHPQYTTTAEASAAAPVQSVAGRTGAVVLTKSDVNLANVDNTSDVDKPVSTAQATAIETARANAIQRSNHTGSQAIATITGLQTALDGKQNVITSTDDIAEGTVNLWFSKTRARASVSVIKTGGEGNIAYSNANGVFVYTGPGATEIRSYFTAGSGIAITNGVISATGGGGGGTGSPSFFVIANVNYVMSSTDDAVISTANTNIIITLPDVSTVKSYYFQNSSNYTMTLLTSNNQIINSDTRLVIQFKNSSCRIISNGLKFFIF